MPSVRIDQGDLSYYEALERATFALQYLLTDCRCSRWCEHRHMVRRVVDEIAARIQGHRAQTAVQVLSAPTKMRALDAFINHGPEFP